MIEQPARAGGGRRKGAIVVLTAGFDPGYRGGGPIRSLTNLAQGIAAHFSVRVVTRDRDLGDAFPYVGVRTNRWIRRDNIIVFYAKHWLSIVRALRSAIDPNASVMYLNSFFDRRYSIIPMLLAFTGIIRPTCIVVAPRGEFSEGAVAIKSFRKWLYIRLAKLSGGYKNITWHATAQTEAEDIQRIMGGRQQIFVAPNIAKLLPAAHFSNDRDSQRAPLRIVFVSRISPKKNLEFAIKVLRGVSIPVEFRVIGPVEDRRYWARCREESQSLPAHVRMTLVGPMEPVEVQKELSQAHLFFLPTLGENYGHAIVEALVAGVPVLISDRTPWRGLAQRGVGWDLSLGDVGAFVGPIEELAALSDESFRAMRVAARRYAEEVLGPKVLEEYVEMFTGCLQHGAES